MIVSQMTCNVSTSVNPAAAAAAAAAATTRDRVTQWFRG